MAFFRLYQVENWIGLSGLFWAPVVVFVFLVVSPFLDRRPERRPRRRPWVIGAALVVFGVWATLTLVVASSGVAAHLG
jgi:ubiquinol-cytochrome c reductase cytochrome b subunit